jgi:hypothetical protein
MRAPAAQLRLLRQREAAGPNSLSRLGSRAGAREGEDRGSGRMWPVLLGCLVLSGFTLLWISTPTYDPWAWIMWGREIAHLDLNTTGGPSWKPLPMFFTIPFSLFGDDVAPYLWLWIARAGALLAVAMAYRIARRIVGGGWYGVFAGAAAALALFSSFRYVRDAMLGNSEAMMAGLVLWAVERHLDGRRDHALYLGVGAALVRPEVWPFLGAYGVYLWFRDPDLRVRLVLFALVIPALWFLPEWWGSGDAFRAGTRANNPNPGSPAYAAHPFLDIASRFRKVVIAPVKVGIIIAAVYAAVEWIKRRREGLTLALFAGGVAWFLLIAGMTEAGFAGNQRYLILATAAAAVLGGVGATRVLQGIDVLGRRTFKSPRAGPATVITTFVLAIGISAPFIVEKANNTGRVLGGLRHEALVYHDLKGIIAEAGGRERLSTCGGIFSGPFQTQMVAYLMHIHGIQVGWRVTPAPGVAFRTRTVPNGPLVVKPTDDRFRQVFRHGKLRLLTAPPEGQRPGPDTCPAAGPDAPRAPLPHKL